MDEIKKNKRQVDYEELKKLRSKIKSLRYSAYNNYMNKLTPDFKSNPKWFWSYVNSLNKRTSIPSIMCIDDVLVSDPQTIVQSFARYFSSSFTNTSGNPNSTSVDYSLNPNLLFVKNDICEEEVLRAISKLKASLTEGPDLIPSFIMQIILSASS